MGTATSASRVCSAPASASLCTATERMPISRSVRITRTAISPRLATRTVSNIAAHLSPIPALMAMSAGFTCGRRHSRPPPTGRSRTPKGEAEHGAGLRGVDHAVVPQAGGGVVGVALRLVLVADRGLERLFVLGGPLLAAGLEAVAADRRQHRRGLLAAHHRDARVRPREQEAGRVRAAAHRVVAGAERAADDDGQLRHPRAGDGGDHLGAVLGDAAGLVVAPDHEAGDVLQEQQRDLPAVAQLDEVRALERGLGEQDAVVRDDPDRMAVQPGEAGDQRRPVERLELGEPAAVDQPGDHVADVVGRARVGRDDLVHRRRVVQRLLGGLDVPRPGAARPERADDLPDDLQRVRVVVGQVVGDAADPAVQVAAPELLGGDHLAGRRLHQRRAAEEDRALLADDHALVAHRRHVRAAGRARPEDGGDLRDAGLRHGRLVVEDAAEVLAVGEHLVLHRQEGPAGVDQVDAGQPVVQGHLLRAQVLLHRHRVVGAALDGGVVGDDDALAAGDPPDAGDDARGRGVTVVQPVRGQRGELQERAAGVEQRVDPVAGQQLAARHVPLAGPLAATFRHPAELLGQVGGQVGVRRGVARGGLTVGARGSGDHRCVHGAEVNGRSLRRSTPRPVVVNGGSLRR